jgi:hypothetical protein
MIYVEAPEMAKTDSLPSVFLAGGITGCGDWLNQVVGSLRNLDIIVYNPRRKNFSVNDSDITEEQIRWEYEHLRKATIISFWFCKETSCPITLYELGCFNMTKKPMVIGMDPIYARRTDVEIQTGLARPEVPIVYSLKDLSKTIVSMFHL